MQKENILNRFKEFIYDQQRHKFNRCLAPFHSCNKKAVKAHSIQNNKILKYLSVNGHVIMLQLVQNLDKGPEMHFKKVGKNEATTFTGLCAYHDNEIFQQIDDSKFDISNKVQLFLLAYRSVIKELHSKMKAANMVQSVYGKAVEYKMSDPEELDLTGRIATIKLIEAYNFYRFKHHFDCVYKYGDYERIKHQIIKIKLKNPTIAVNSIYSPINYLATIETRLFPPCILINVFPQGDFTYVVFSYFKEHSSKIKHYIDMITTATGNYQNYLISKIILTHCENFVLSPTHYETFNEEKKKKIKDFFVESTFSEDEYDDPYLYLF